MTNNPTIPPSNDPPLSNPRDRAAFRRALLRWSAAYPRWLPWREEGDPYRVWISEVMLQQTTVASVIPYYERFLIRFPDVTSLALADETEVLRLWEGLGYYSRARNLLQGARLIVEQRGGDFPKSLDALQRLPGVGRYTASAIASFAFDLHAPIVEANTLRLYCRLLGYEGNPRSAAGQEILWKFAKTILPREHPGRFNQALMDLGAMVCVPTNPHCPSCPVRRWCRALRDNRVAEIPRPVCRPAVTEQTAYAVAVRKKGAYLLRRNPPSERWGGLWDFPRFETEANQDLNERQLVQLIHEKTGLAVRLGPLLDRLRHSVTRYRITLYCHSADVLGGRLKRGEEWAWIPPDRYPELPLSVTSRKLAVRLRAATLDASAP